ncbi:MAG TPA: indole-3-glycerol phosphate synthase TrpC [Acidimicrobiales bacterium]|nr:indole-3-glycerol phosphate synthase TrpC [Acidimicrobiales bacterium]
MPTYLADIVAAHRKAAAADDRDVDALVEAAVAAPRGPGFAAALAARAATGMAVIAEVKRRSPSRGDLAPGLDPAEVAAAYARGGAACLSVLTDDRWFGGSAEDLAAAKAASGLPVLRKDFTVAAADVCDARLMGADAVLLIVAALDGDELASFLSLAGHLGLDALVEVHDEAELDRALEAGATLVGVNQRDLRTFEVDPQRALRLAATMPAGVVAVAESGIRDPSDAARLAEAGYQAVLVGEALVCAADRAQAVRSMGGHPVGRRVGAGTRR